MRECQASRSRLSQIPNYAYFIIAGSILVLALLVGLCYWMKTVNQVSRDA